VLAAVRATDSACRPRRCAYCVRRSGRYCWWRQHFWEQVSQGGGGIVQEVHQAAALPQLLHRWLGRDRGMDGMQVWMQAHTSHADHTARTRSNALHAESKAVTLAWRGGHMQGTLPCLADMLALDTQFTRAGAGRFQGCTPPSSLLIASL
jgi:hypothetical protein